MLPQEYKVEGFQLGVWVVTQRQGYKNNRLSEHRKKLLDEMGFMWDPLHSSWEQNLLLLRRFREEKCHCLVPEEYEVEGVRLGR